MPQPSLRIQHLPANFFASIEAKISAMQAAGTDVIRLDIGSPDLPPPPAVLAALCGSAAQPGHHGYQPHAGRQSLRVAWAQYYRQLYQVDLNPETEILPLLGSKEGIFNFIQAWTDPGDVVLVPDPGYMTYRNAALFAGGEPYPVRLLPERGYAPDLQSIPAGVLRRAKMLWLNYPNNPTAAAANHELFAAAASLAREYGFWLCHDAAYARVTFDGCRAPSILELPGAREVAVEFNSLSKSHNMAGWRVGAALGNADALRPLFHLKSNLDSSHFLPVMDAAEAALAVDQGWIDERNSIYRERRDLVLAGLARMELRPATPPGSIYVWSPVPEGWTSLDFVTSALEHARVSLTPGTVFGSAGEGFMRISLTLPAEQLGEALYRLETWRNR